MVLNMPIGERDHAATVMGAVGKVEETVTVHVHAEVGPANAVWVDILEEKHPGRQRGNQLRMPGEHLVGRRKPSVPGPAPSQITIERIAADLRISLAINLHRVRI